MAKSIATISPVDKAAVSIIDAPVTGSAGWVTKNINMHWKHASFIHT